MSQFVICDATGETIRITDRLGALWALANQQADSAWLARNGRAVVLYATAASLQAREQQQQQAQQQQQ